MLNFLVIGASRSSCFIIYCENCIMYHLKVVDTPNEYGIRYALNQTMNDYNRFVLS